MNSVIIPFSKSTDDSDAVLSVRAYVGTAGSNKELDAILTGFDRVRYEIVEFDEESFSGFEKGRSPNIVIVEQAEDPQAARAWLDRFFQEGAGRDVRLVLASNALSQADMLQYIRMGVSDFLSYPFDKEEVAQVLSRLIDRTPAKAVRAGNNRRVVAFLHASGGVGTTTIAVNTALEFARQSKAASSRVCLIDFDVQFGDVALQLDIAQSSPVFDLIENPGRLDAELLQAMMVKFSSGLHVLTTPAAPIPYSALDRDLVSKIVELAHELYDYVIIDMPQCLTSWADEVIKKSTDVFVVSRVDVPSIRHSKRLLDTFEQEGLDSSSFQVLINEYASSPFVRTSEDIDIRQAEKSLKRRIRFTFPAAAAQMKEAVNAGQPTILTKPKSPYSKCVGKLVASLVAVDRDQAAAFSGA